MKRTFVGLLGCWLAGPAFAGPPAPPSIPVPASLLIPTPAASRAPTPNDDWTAGYFAAGNISNLYVSTAGVCTAAPTISIAAPSSGVTATFSASLSGATPVATLTNPGSGYTGNPTVTVSGGACTTTPVWTALYQPIGALWLDASGNVYSLTQSNQGQAAWQNQLAGTLPGDVTTGVIAEFGMIALNKAWANGNWLDVATTAGGTATTFAFINGQPDLAGLCKFLGNAPGYVSKWYDQSGAALNATQTTAANQPSIRCGIGTGAAPSLIFDSTLNGTIVLKYLVLPAGVTTTTNNDAILAFGRAHSSIRGSAVAELSGTNPQSVSVGNSGAPGVDYWYIANYSQKNVAPETGETPGVVGFVSSSTAQTTIGGTSATVNAAGSTATEAGGFIGDVTKAGARHGYMELGAVLIYNAAPSMANAALIEASLIKSFNAPPQSRDVYVFDGDSITEGYLTTQLQNYQRQSEGMFKYPGRFYNVSVWGNTTEQQITNYPTYAAHLYNPQARNNIISMAAGTNSLGAAGESETVAYAALTTYVALAHATGFKVICATLLPTTTGTQSKYVNYNAFVRTNAAGCDGIADIASDPTMGPWSAASNTLLYNPDGLHPTVLGDSYIAPYFASAFNALIH